MKKFEFYEVVETRKNGDSYSTYRPAKEEALELARESYRGLTSKEQDETDVCVKGYYITLPDDADTSNIDSLITAINNGDIDCPEHIGYFPDDCLIFSDSLNGTVVNLEHKLLKRAEQFAAETSEVFSESYPDGFDVSNAGVGFLDEQDGELVDTDDQVDFIDDRRALREAILRNVWTSREAYLYIVSDDGSLFIDTKFGVDIDDCAIKDYKTYDMFVRPFREQLRTAREMRGLTQRKAAELLSVPLRTYEDWERGLRTPPTYTQEAMISEMKNR